MDKWKKLSRIDVASGVEKKGNLDYLSWAYAWKELMDVYPDSTFEFLDPTTFPDGSVMVKTSVTVTGQTYHMQLPVMDHRNKAISSPNARDISDAYMRCLVKNIALHGIGISLYLGDLRGTVQKTHYEKAAELVEAGDPIEFHRFIKGLPERDQVELFNDAPAGKKTAFKNAHRALISKAEEFLNEAKSAIVEAIDNDDGLLLEETTMELSAYERNAVWARLDEHQKQEIQRLKGV